MIPNVSYEMCDFGRRNMSAGLFLVCPLSQSCVSLSPPSIYCVAALESMQECEESCWVAHTSKTAPQSPHFSSERDHRSENGGLPIGQRACSGHNFCNLSLAQCELNALIGLVDCLL